MRRSQDIKYPSIYHELPEFTSQPILPRTQLPKAKRGEDPKSDFIPYCTLQCNDWKKAYENCEKVRTNPHASTRPNTCVYLYKEMLECIEGCVQPKVLNELYGINAKYHNQF
eukprot:TRINITY_DN1118_c0_g1_i17.p3 TRINITY_DN1118_c0_g1~~TRINITY_DN1118_c0_g1_i17.p3  ORF type:complete len:112 (-),score=48.79 TRINITY_DN1118_c0_g1_i17:42-377(-)